MNYGWTNEDGEEVSSHHPTPADSQAACWYGPLAAARLQRLLALFFYRRPLGWFRQRGAAGGGGESGGSLLLCSVCFFSRHRAPPPQGSLLTLLHIRGRKPADLTREGDRSESLSNFQPDAVMI